MNISNKKNLIIFIIIFILIISIKNKDNTTDLKKNNSFNSFKIKRYGDINKNYFCFSKQSCNFDKNKENKDWWYLCGTKKNAKKDCKKKFKITHKECSKLCDEDPKCNAYEIYNKTGFLGSTYCSAWAKNKCNPNDTSLSYNGSTCYKLKEKSKDDLIKSFESKKITKKTLEEISNNLDRQVEEEYKKIQDIKKGKPSWNFFTKQLLKLNKYKYFNILAKNYKNNKLINNELIYIDEDLAYKMNKSGWHVEQFKINNSYYKKLHRFSDDDYDYLNWKEIFKYINKKLEIQRIKEEGCKNRKFKSCEDECKKFGFESSAHMMSYTDNFTGLDFNKLGPPNKKYYCYDHKSCSHDYFKEKKDWWYLCKGKDCNVSHKKCSKLCDEDPNCFSYEIDHSNLNYCVGWSKEKCLPRQLKKSNKSTTCYNNNKYSIKELKKTHFGLHYNDIIIKLLSINEIKNINQNHNTKISIKLPKNSKFFDLHKQLINKHTFDEKGNIYLTKEDYENKNYSKVTFKKEVNKILEGICQKAGFKNCDEQKNMKKKEKEENCKKNGYKSCREQEKKEKEKKCKEAGYKSCRDQEKKEKEKKCNETRIERNPPYKKNDCPWKKYGENSNKKDTYVCMDGKECNIVSCGKNCCDKHGGIALCSKNNPYMTTDNYKVCKENKHHQEFSKLKTYPRKCEHSNKDLIEFEKQLKKCEKDNVKLCEASCKIRGFKSCEDECKKNGYKNCSEMLKNSYDSEDISYNDLGIPDKNYFCVNNKTCKWSYYEKDKDWWYLCEGKDCKNGVSHQECSRLCDLDPKCDAYEVEKYNRWKSPSYCSAWAKNKCSPKDLSSIGGDETVTCYKSKNKSRNNITKEIKNSELEKLNMLKKMKKKLLSSNTKESKLLHLPNNIRKKISQIEYKKKKED